jgi:hypothetical protein
MHGPVLEVGVTSAVGAAPDSGSRSYGEQAEFGGELRGVDVRALRRSSAGRVRGTCPWASAAGRAVRHAGRPRARGRAACRLSHQRHLGSAGIRRGRGNVRLDEISSWSWLSGVTADEALKHVRG